MSFRERLHDLQTPEEVDRFLKQHAVCVFFKAGGCHKTMQGFGNVEQLLFDRDVPVGVVRVVEGGRPAAVRIASPQATPRTTGVPGRWPGTCGSCLVTFLIPRALL